MIHGWIQIHSSLHHGSDTYVVLLTSAYLRDICRTPNHRETAVFPVMVVDSEALVALVLLAARTIEHVSEDRAILSLVPTVVAEGAPLDICGERYDIVIHILVNLNGHTAGDRNGISALRPAPLQLVYLAYPGTMGANYIDYNVTDETVCPSKHREFYTERLLYMPHCYQTNSFRELYQDCLLYTSPSPRDKRQSRMPSSA